MNYQWKKKSIMNYESGNYKRKKLGMTNLRNNECMRTY